MPYALITPDIRRRRTAYMSHWRQRNRAARNAYNRRWMAERRKAEQRDLPPRHCRAAGQQLTGPKDERHGP